MCKIRPKQTTVQTTVASYYVTVVLDLPSESEYRPRFTINPYPDFRHLRHRSELSTSLSYQDSCM